MNDQNPAENGNISLVISFFLSIFSWLTPANIDLILKVVTGLGALVGVFFAVRYHIAATKLKNKELEILKKKNNE